METEAPAPLHTILVTIFGCSSICSSCSVTSLVFRRRVRRVQSQNQSYFATDGRSVSQSVLALSNSGTPDQILVVVKTITLLFVMGRSLWREDGSVV